MRGDPAARIGEDLPEGAERVYHVYDFDGTAYDGDVGALAAGHPESERLGFRSRREFDAMVRELRAGGEVPHGGEFAAILERHARADLRTVARVVNESQNPGRLRAGFEAAVPAFGDDLRVVTAGPVAAPGADVDLGADYSAERDREGAVSSLESKQETLDERIEEIRSEITEIETETEKLEDRAEQLQAQQMQQMQQQSDE